MSRKFVTQREIDFIAGVTKELLQGVVEEKVRYYSISIEHSTIDRLYDEAVRKVWAPPVEFDALVHWDQGSTVSGRFGMDASYTIEVYAHKKELLERNLEVKEGDFVEYGGVFFEITTAAQPQIIFGQVNNKVMVRMTCVKSREGQFAAGGDSTRGIAKDTPIENVAGTPPTNSISTDATYATNPFSTSTQFAFPLTYWGVAAAQGSYSQSFVTSLSGSDRYQGRSNVDNMTLNVTTGYYGYIVLPTSYNAEESSFIDDETGFEAGFSLYATLDVTDSINGAVSHEVWRTRHPGLGQITVRMV